MEKKVFLCVDGFFAKNDEIFLLKRNVEPFRVFGLVLVDLLSQMKLHKKPYAENSRKKLI